jgi:transcriptional regulator with GAF, ATPase, and Fis domain
MIDNPVRFDGVAVTEAGKATPEYLRALATEIWREACRSIAIVHSTEGIARILTRYFPLHRVIVRRLDTQRSALETVANASGENSRPLQGARTECTVPQMERVSTWCRHGRIAHRFSASPEIDWEVILPIGIQGDVLAGPLGDEKQPEGILLLVAADGQAFEPQHEAMVEMLLGPFATALENDRRFREMEALRAAAEAERRSLLTRLGRKDLTDVVVGADSGLRAVMERVELVARSDVPVLILGETGTGKEVIARLIHTHSSRDSGPFLRVNCGAIPPELIDSQLFGHERGAFTGAVDMHQGWFERANGGTLLLDEIGELPLAAQVRLLRILQDGWLERVGGRQSINVDVRIVAATHRDLAAMVTQGKFREDLWYRIAVFPVLLPPLRERPEDIPELARHFAERAASRFVLPLALPLPEDLELLRTYPWPGNIRELAAVIDRAAILGNGQRLEIAKALGTPSRQEPAAPSGCQKPGCPSAAAEIVSLDEAMKRHIVSALLATRGRIEGRRGVAALLKINPHTLRARMRKLGVDWDRFRDHD